MKKDRVDPGRLEGEALERWYLQTPDEIEADREAVRIRRFNEFFGRTDGGRSSDALAYDDTDTSAPSYAEGWQDARVTVRPPSVMPVRPGGVRIGVPVDGNGAPVRGPPGGFFETHEPADNPTLGPAYYTDLPRPLNVVTPRFSGWFELGDGTLVTSAEEVERIHAEQQRRMRGEDDPEPAATVRTVDRLQDGFIPRADQLEKRQWERDATCHPNGGWERDENFKTYPEGSRKYQEQITHAGELDYVVRNPGEKPVKFDGCAVWDPRHPLLEAKGPGYAGLAEAARRWRFMDSFRKKTGSQAQRQADAARRKPVEWHVAEPDAMPFFSNALAPHPSIGLIQTPAR